MDDQIKKIINEEIRPHIQADGGDIEFVKYDKKTAVVYVRLHGACAGCPISHVTLHDGIEKMIQEKLPEVRGVEAVD